MVAWVLPAIALAATAAQMASQAAQSGASNETQSNIANANLKQQGNDAAYRSALSAEAMRRASAGTSDSYGTTTQYDPYTNTWKAQLGDIPGSAQTAKYGADIIRGGVDAPRATYGNDQAMIREALATRNLSGVGNQLANYTPVSGRDVQGDLDSAAIRANNATFAPLVQSTLRQFARAGTAAGPVLAQLGKASGENLANTMAGNAARGRESAATINATNRASLGDTYKTFLGGTQQPRNYSPSPGSDPQSQITAILSSRPGAQSQAATSGANVSAYGSLSGNQAAALGAKYPGGYPLDAVKAYSLASQGGDLARSIYDMFGKQGASGPSILPDDYRALAQVAQYPAASNAF